MPQGKRRPPCSSIWLAITSTLIATGISCKSLIGLPGLAYAGDLTYVQLYLPVPIAVFIVTMVFLPFYSRLKVTSAYEYLGLRFGNGVRTFGSLLYQVEHTLVLGTVIAAPSLVMSEAVGLPYELCIMIMLGLTVLYTSIGGMKGGIFSSRRGTTRGQTGQGLPHAARGSRPRKAHFDCTSNRNMLSVSWST